MPRVKRGNVRRAKRKKLLARAKGFYQTKSKLYRSAKESVDTALKYAFVGRRRKKRDFRRLWVMRINAAARENGLTYGQLIAGLKAAGNTIDRKTLADLAVTQPAAFARLVKVAADAKPAPAKRLASGLGQGGKAARRARQRPLARSAGSAVQGSSGSGSRTLYREPLNRVNLMSDPSIDIEPSGRSSSAISRRPRAQSALRAVRDRYLARKGGSSPRC